MSVVGWQAGVGVLLAINWEQWTAIATTVYAGITGVALVAIFIGYFQFRASIRARHLDVIENIYRELHSHISKADRKAIYESKLDTMADDDLEAFFNERKLASSSLTVEAVERIADSWQHIGLLAFKNFVDKPILFDYFHWPLLNSYRKLRRYIRWRQRRWNPEYGQFFVRLASDFEERFKKRWGEDEFARRFKNRTLQDV